MYNFFGTYCPALETNIALKLHTVSPCSPGMKYILPEIKYTDFTIDNYLKMREHTRQEIESGKSPCLNCPSLKKGIHFKRRYLFNSITFEHFTVCNSKCSYCDVWKTDCQEYHAYPIFKWLLDNNYLNPHGRITWGGGEPTILPEFADIMELANNKGMKAFVNTSGIILSEPLLNSLNLGKTTIQISLDAGDKQTYNDMKGQDGFYKVIKNIELYSLYSTPRNFILKYIINDKNNSESSISGFLDICQTYRCKVTLSPETREAWDHRISNQTLKGIDFFLSETRKRGIRVTLLKDLFGKEYMDKI